MSRSWRDIVPKTWDILLSIQLSQKGIEGTALMICAVAAHHKLDEGKEPRHQMQSGSSQLLILSDSWLSKCLDDHLKPALAKSQYDPP